MSNPLNSSLAEEEEGEFVSPFARSDNINTTTTTTTSNTLSYPTEEKQEEQSSPSSQQQEQPTQPQKPKKKKPAQPKTDTDTSTTTEPVAPPVASKKPEWVPDNSSNKCEMCSSTFTFLNRSIYLFLL